MVKWVYERLVLAWYTITEVQMKQYVFSMSSLSSVLLIFLGVNFSRFSQYDIRVFPVGNPCTGLESLAKFPFCFLFYFKKLFSYD